MAPSRRKGSKAAAAAAAAKRQWKVGDLVLAKVKGFQAWPAMVSEPEKWGYSADWKKVLVCFFGTQQIAFCNPADVEAFTEEKKQRLLGKRHGKYSEFGRALIEIVDTFEKLKKQDEGYVSNDTDEEAMVIENNTSEVLKKSVSSDKSPIATSEACQRKILSSGTQVDVSGGSGCDGDGDDMNCNEGMSEREVPLKDSGSGMAGVETDMITTYSTRRRSQRTQASKSSFLLRRSLSARPCRSSPRIDVIELQNVSDPSGNCVKSIGDVPSSLRDRSAWRNKRMRKTPDLDDNEVDSPDVVSNCSAEGNDSGSLTADSDAISFNEGSTTEWDLKSVQPVSVTDFVQPDIEFCQRFDFQTNNIINKKKRKPKRRRLMKESEECTEKLDEKVASDSDVKSETILRSDHERSPERCSKEDGDAHLPLLKRARVRMGRALSTTEDLDTSEEKLQEESQSLSDQVFRSLHGEVDCSTDQEALHDNADVNKSSPVHKHPDNLLLWETAAPSASSLDVEAALPPSKRLHRALEAMSVNAAEDKKKYVDGPPTKMDGSGQNRSSSFNDFYNSTKIKNCSELQLGKEEEFSNNNFLDGPLESPLRLNDMPIEVGKASSTERTIQITSDSPIHDSPKDVDRCSDSSQKESVETTVVEYFESLLPHICEQVDQVTCHSGSPCKATTPSDDRFKTTATVLAEPLAEIDGERPGVNCDVTSGDSVAVQSLDNGMTVLEDSADDSGKTTKSCDLSFENCKDLRVLNAGEDVVENETTERGSGPFSSLASPQAMLSLCNGENQAHSGLRDVDLFHSVSVSDDHSLDKSVSVSQSSSSLTDGLDSVSHATPHTLASNAMASDKISAQFNGSCSPGVHSHFDVPKRVSKWNNKEGQVNLASFEAMLGTLTRAKESIGRATRVAIDCAKCGVAAKVVEVLAHNLEKESSLHRRVDLFFLVDSIAQGSKGLKGDFTGVYPSAILAVLPRLLSAAAPPGSSSRENRRQCLKVLRVWLERRILPESIIRHHIRELNSYCGSPSSRTSSRSFRKERPFDDPVREMEGMLVDEYGSNSSFQLPGFCMPRMMRDDDDGVDSDGESFEAVTPEHNAVKPEVSSPVPAVEKHRHILEDVDGELEMEDVAPAEGVDTACDMAGMNSLATSNLQIVNLVAEAAAPPLPKDVPPSYPPLPSSPPPPPAPLPPLPPAVRTDTFTSNHNSKVYASSQVPNQIPNPANCSSFGDQYASHPQIQSAHRNAQADVKGFRLRPPHPAPSNHFSYVQNERLQSQRDTPPHSNSNRFHMPNTENGNVYRDCERMKLPPYGAQEHWRTPQPFPGPNYPDSSGIPYAPAPFAPQNCEPYLPNHQSGFPSRGMNHQEFMHHAPPSGGPIPVSARGANFWRPR